MKLSFRAPWACCTTCRAHLALNHDSALCAEISGYLQWLRKLADTGQHPANPADTAPDPAKPADTVS